jgi:hypothetical protein
MEDTQKRGQSEKRVFGAVFREPPQGMCNPSFDLLKELKKGEILHLRDDYRPYMRTRDWVFVDLFQGGGVFLHRKGEGFLEVKVREIDWESYKRKKE